MFLVKLADYILRFKSDARLSCLPRGGSRDIDDGREETAGNGMEES